MSVELNNVGFFLDQIRDDLDDLTVIRRALDKHRKYHIGSGRHETDLEVIARLASTQPTATAVNTSGREVKKGGPVFGYPAWYTNAWAVSIRDRGCCVRGCTRPHGHSDDHKLVYRVGTNKRTIPPHAAITDTPQGRMATWYEPNRGDK